MNNKKKRHTYGTLKAQTKLQIDIVQLEKMTEAKN